MSENTGSSAGFQKVITGLMRVVENPSIAFHFWDGAVLDFSESNNPLLRIHLKNKEALTNLFFSLNDLALTEAYFNDHIDLDGDLLEAVRIGDELSSHQWTKGDIIKLSGSALSVGASALLSKAGNAFSGKGKLHSIDRDKEAIAYHYDTSNAFFKLWLDKNMVYSGAYFRDEDESLDDAQERKMDYICRKLQLKEGETLLDIGCGWGSFVIYAAAKYKVKAVGISLSQKQIDFANERIRQLELQDRCTVKYADYRELPETETYDKISSIEMLHHIGKEKLPEYFTTVRKHLKPDGISFQLSITSVPARGMQRNPQFVDRYFQPDFHLASISTLTHEAETAGFEIFDVENVRRHYYLTSKHWLARLERAHDETLKEVNEFTYRVIRLGLLVMMIGFQRGNVGFYHFVLLNKKTDIRSLPLARSGA